ncbi:hypothetical protein ASG01_08005 [Chryseobacterium sp. Leaf180]|jgi:hypothetical protein|uniref:DUF6452 family protein n=1 Tax=Chryseobacterium sp. Leaf180 TaxID=1736289 RepID=UPI0006F670BC|nr:DUF6452 family protein [Chryseobacterium sp. Leaf180]KQR93797.1 hypothetical protein ASG01_08005 [Chryseobacterium sp. Leaf180]
MKILSYILLAVFAFSIISCGGDDDICESGEGTPRIKIRFKTINALNNTLRTVDTLYVSADLGNGKVSFGKSVNVDSILIPLRVDDAPYTDLYVKTRLTQTESKIRVKYSTTSKYVSPGCGFKKSYQNLSSEVLISNIIKNTEIGQNFIENEDKTNLFLLF